MGNSGPQEQVSDLKSGIKAMSREFGFGLYDGVTELVTQPWRGAQKEGAGGFLKGIGKGIGGLVAKPGAALFAIPSYMMKGVHKEVQKLFSSNVQNYIIASRAAQGYDEWSQSSGEEKKDVIDRWKLIQKHLKKKRNPVQNEILKEVLDSQWNGGNVNGRQQDFRHAAGSSQSGDEFGCHSGNIIPSAIAETPTRPTHSTHTEDADVARAIRETISLLLLHGQETATRRADPDDWRKMTATDEKRTHGLAGRDLKSEEELERAMVQSLGERRYGSSIDGESDVSLDDDEAHESGQVTRRFETMESSGAQQLYLFDHGHLAGTTQSTSQMQEHREKINQEKTEEEIVFEYVKKQTLLEAHHQRKGKGRVVMDDEDEELQRALKLSMQGF